MSTFSVIYVNMKCVTPRVGHTYWRTDRVTKCCSFKSCSMQLKNFYFVKGVIWTNSRPFFFSYFVSILKEIKFLYCIKPRVNTTSNSNHWGLYLPKSAVNASRRFDFFQKRYFRNSLNICEDSSGHEWCDKKAALYKVNEEVVQYHFSLSFSKAK